MKIFLNQNIANDIANYSLNMNIKKIQKIKDT